jgi:hypothetical protein
MTRRLFVATCSSTALGAVQRKKPAPKGEPLLTRILRITGISATSRGLKGGPLPSLRGDVWVMPADGKDKTQRRLTWDGDYHSPVFTPDDRKLLVLWGQRIVWITSVSGAIDQISYELPGVVRLVGFEKQPDLEKPRVVAITKDAVGLFSPWDGKFEPFPKAEGDWAARTQLLRGQLRSKDLQLQVGHAGHELTLQKNDEGPVVLASAPNVAYIDPTASHDGVIVAFIRANVAAR